jgi:16S rRNA processing protein RimM
MSGLDQQPESNSIRNTAKNTGSQDNSEPVFLVVGKLRKPHGLQGEIAMEIKTDFPERLQPELPLFIGPNRLPTRILKYRQHKNLLLVILEGYPTREALSVLRNQDLFVSAADIPPLPQGEFYHHQLLGLNVYDDQGTHLGEIAEIIETGANDVFIVRSPSGPDLLIPYLNTLVIRIDLGKRELHTRLLQGLLPDDQNHQG